MKKKFIIISVCLCIILTYIFTTIVITSNANHNKKILTGEKINSIDEVYKELNNFKTTRGTEKYNISLISELNDEIVNDSNYDSIKYYQRGLDSRIEAVIKKDGAKISFNHETGEFLSYNAKEDMKYLETTLNEDQIRKIAIELYQQLSIKEDNYEIIELSEFDTEIWRAVFAKKYDDLINRGESITISFAPETKQIVTIHKNNIKFANNSIEISEENARKIANNYNLKNVDMSCSIDIVRPNYFFETDDYLYKKINTYRKAYVFTLNDDNITRIYVDCTTGELIGGDMNI